MLARIWVCIADIMNGDLTALERTNLLVWQPAHQTVQSIGQRHGSDGKKITTVDWRANRLVDALAKQAAEQVRATKEARELICSGREAVRHAACKLGQITFAANNHTVERLGEDGKMHTETRRDSQDAPKRKPTARNTEAEVVACMPCPEPVAAQLSQGAVACVPSHVPVAAQITHSEATNKRVSRPLELKDQGPPCKKRLTAARHRAERVQAERTALKRNLEHKASLLTQSVTETAATRMEHFRKRVRLRLEEGQTEQV
jgi:hypothetical protein